MRYLLTFKPLKHFFFGNNKTFSDDYLAVSEYFPQNTQLLGALRLYIAEQSELMKVYRSGKWCDKPEELKSLTGSATSKDFMTNNNLGKIQNLSQMFVVSKDLDDAYFQTPLDVKIDIDKHGTQIMNDNGDIHTVSYPQKAKLTYYELASLDDEYFLKNYDAKDYSSQMLGNKAFWNFYTNKEPRSINGLYHFEKNDAQYHGMFIPHSQVGIELENKQTVDEKFYSKIDYQLNDKFLFACVIDLEEKILDDGIIQIGAESSLFELKVQKLEDTNITDHKVIQNIFNTPKDGDKIVAMSDVIIDSTDNLNAKFSIIPYYKNFAMIKSDDNSFTGKSKEKENQKFKRKTSPKRVIPAGSVIFTENIPSQNIGAYAKMGYNQFIAIQN